ncbi:Uncharacterized protein SCF082_LOCUS2363 [Durusdinium trenchii]|uniref:Uncharacterized protein n=1 Tax=Durusdinium trenchii TaxID=1381693 RepID=A0ABP0HKI4_9DINO
MGHRPSCEARSATDAVQKYNPKTFTKRTQEDVDNAVGFWFSLLDERVNAHRSPAQIWEVLKQIAQATDYFSDCIHGIFEDPVGGSQSQCIQWMGRRTADGHPGIFTKKGPEDTGPAAEDADYADLVMIYLFADAATYSAVPLPSLASPNAVSQRPLKRTCKDHLCVNFRHLQCCAVDPVIAG